MTTCRLLVVDNDDANQKLLLAAAQRAGFGSRT